MTDLPDDVVADATTLTRRALDAVDDQEATAYRDRRDAKLANHGYTARVRRDHTGDVLVLYPTSWLDETGTVDFDSIEDVDDAVEIALDDAADAANWESVAERNESVAAEIRARHGPVHGENADAFATFMSNHYAAPVDEATDAIVEEFLSEYYPRNTWPTSEQQAVVEQTLAYVAEFCEE